MLQHAALVGLRREAGARLLPALARGVASWAKFNPNEMSGTKPAQVSNLGERRRRRCLPVPPARCRCAESWPCVPNRPASLQCLETGCSLKRRW